MLPHLGLPYANVCPVVASAPVRTLVRVDPKSVLTRPEVLMGGGNKQSADAAKAPPFQALVDIKLVKDAGASSASGSLVVEQCEARRQLSFIANTT